MHRSASRILSLSLLVLANSYEIEGENNYSGSRGRNAFALIDEISSLCVRLLSRFVGCRVFRLNFKLGFAVVSCNCRTWVKCECHSSIILNYCVVKNFLKKKKIIKTDRKVTTITINH